MFAVLALAAALYAEDKSTESSATLHSPRIQKLIGNSDIRVSEDAMKGAAIKFVAAPKDVLAGQEKVVKSGELVQTVLAGKKLFTVEAGNPFESREISSMIRNIGNDLGIGSTGSLRVAGEFQAMMERSKSFENLGNTFASTTFGHTNIGGNFSRRVGQYARPLWQE